MDPLPHVAVILVNWNSMSETQECLESLLEITYPHYDIIVVDNNSSDESAPRLKEWATGKRIRVAEYSRSEAESGGRGQEEMMTNHLPSNGKLTLIQSDKNLGFAGGNNIGIRFALSREHISLIWLLNNDTIVAQDALLEMIKKLKTTCRTAFCGSVILDYYHPNRIQTIGGGLINRYLGLPRPIMKNAAYDLERIHGKTEKIDYVSGCSLLMEKRHLMEIGIMDESYFLYWEDTEWSERSRRMGFSLTYAVGSKVWHKKGKSSVISQKGSYYDTLNCLRFFRRYHPGYLPLVLISRLIVGMLIGFKHADGTYLREFFRGYACFLRSTFIQRSCP